jgi:hypothetical protein
VFDKGFVNVNKMGLVKLREDVDGLGIQFSCMEATLRQKSINSVMYCPHQLVILVSRCFNLSLIKIK